MVQQHIGLIFLSGGSIAFSISSDLPGVLRFNALLENFGKNYQTRIASF
jgi:hypothetical protein